MATARAKALAELIINIVDNSTKLASMEVYPTNDQHGFCSNAMCQACSEEAAGSTPVLVSGAGHDAMVLASITKMAMLFVRCR